MTAKRSVVCLLAMAGFLGISTAQDATPEPEPYRVDFIEETGIDLILLDVEVYDKDGRPMRSLKKEDFTLKINGKVRIIYSVDDLCSCSDTIKDELVVTDATDAAQVPAEPMLFILYLDFGQLQQDGRINALAEAERWIREVMQPGEQVQIWAYATRTGLLELTRVTDDKDELLAALRAAENNPELIDPFPNLRLQRQAECADCWSDIGDSNKSFDRSNQAPDLSESTDLVSDAMNNLVKTEQDSIEAQLEIILAEHSTSLSKAKCRVLAMEEYYHGQRSLAALQQLLYRLEGIRGRKTLLYFFQSAILYPSRLFTGLEDIDVLDLNPDLEQVGADAVLSRTSITAAFTGDYLGPNAEDVEHAINVGANLADYSGGSYNRAAHLMPEVTGKAGRGCRCFYRIGVEPPPMRRNDLYHATVYVHDRKIPRGFRLQHLTGFDRWLREANAVLLSPEGATDLTVTASLLPAGIEKGRWKLTVRVAVIAEQLLLLPAAGGKTGSWETGALMYRDSGADAKELLADSYLTVESQAVPGCSVVHERILEGIRPGELHLGAFVRDRNANAFGGSKSTMTLPKPGEAGLSTPVPLQTGRHWIRTGFPDLTDKQKKIEDETRTQEILQEPFPLPGRPVRRGHDLEFRSWVCSPKKGEGDAVVRYIARDGEPIFRFETVTPPKGGSCIELVDPVETRYLEPGEYVYHIRYSPEGRPELLAEETVFILE